MKANKEAVAARLGGMTDALSCAMKALEVAMRGKDLLDESDRRLLSTAHDTLFGVSQRIDARLWSKR